MFLQEPARTAIHSLCGGRSVETVGGGISAQVAELRMGDSMHRTHVAAREDGERVAG